MYNWLIYILGATALIGHFEKAHKDGFLSEEECIGPSYVVALLWPAALLLAFISGLWFFAQALFRIIIDWKLDD